MGNYAQLTNPLRSQKWAPHVVESIDGKIDTFCSPSTEIRQQGACDDIKLSVSCWPHPHGHSKYAHFDLPCVEKIATTKGAFAADMAS
jgi:hypothetical protein